MPTFSMLASLKKIGEPRPGKPIPALRSGFHSAPSSVRAALRAMNSPGIAEWGRVSTREFDNETWTEECQGLTSDGQFWFVSSNNEDHRAIHKFTLGFKHLGSATFPSELGSHIGAPDFRNGTVFAPAEPTLRVLMFDTSPQFVGSAALTKGSLSQVPQTHMSWCAINPWNGLLYSSDFDNVDRVHAYDPANNFGFEKSLVLEGGAVNGVQGGVFSGNGHLYLASDASQEIRAYSALNGAFLGSRKLDYSKSFDEAEELEGLALLPIVVNGIPAQVHVLILDNDLTNDDDVFLQHFMVPSPDDL